VRLVLQGNKVSRVLKETLEQLANRVLLVKVSQDNKVTPVQRVRWDLLVTVVGPVLQVKVLQGNKVTRVLKETLEQLGSRVVLVQLVGQVQLGL
jgi:hypothetical protein